jgi:small subunit ribosomal protein S20
LANSLQAKKRIRQAEKHRQHNAGLRSMLRTFIKRVYAAIAANDAQTATTSYQAAVPIIDRMVNKKIIHKNKAARHKSRICGHIKRISNTASAQAAL